LGALLLLVGAALALGLTGTHIGRVHYSLHLGGIPPAGAAAGAFVGLYLVRRRELANTRLDAPAPQERPNKDAEHRGDVAQPLRHSEGQRDWFQIIINGVVVLAFCFLAYNAFSHPHTALTVALPLAGAVIFLGLIGVAGTLIGRSLRVAGTLICKIDDKRRGEPSDFSLADRMRLRLLSKPWLANWFPHSWDRLREDLRRSRCCEISDCWNDATCKWDEHNVCSEHYARIAEIAAADQRRAAIKDTAVPPG
jgi:hypothetical protein